MQIQSKADIVTIQQQKKDLDIRNEDIILKTIESITRDSSSYYSSIFKTILSKNLQNAKILCDFILDEYNTNNVKPTTILTHIKIIYLFNRFLDYIDFRKIIKQDIINYLNSLRKPESIDPTHKWIGTYNTRQIILSKFFRWLYNNEDEIDQEKWITPTCMQGIKPLQRKEKSPFKPSDLWTNEDHSIFLRYCPVKRDLCYHAMANDTSARPHELLSIKIKDIKSLSQN